MANLIDCSVEFPLNKDIIYLNHAGISPWPIRAASAVKKFAEENSYQGSQNYSNWLQQEKILKKQLAKLINAPSFKDIALLKNTSEGLSVVAYGLHWQKGDNVIICQQEFPSNKVVWESLKEKGVGIRWVDLNGEIDPEEKIISLVDDHTKLISVSSVQYSSGLKMDLIRIGQFCQNNSVLFCIDAIQSIGCIQFDVQQIQADFVTADAHKWMLGPEGVALFYCRRALLGCLQLNQYGWHMLENKDDFQQTQWKIADDARRFECGSPNMLGIHAHSASLSLIHEIGMPEIEKRVLANTVFLQEQLTALKNIEVLSDIRCHRFAGITCFSHRVLDNVTVYNQLRNHNVICALRGEGIRFSPHFYTSQSQLEHTVALLEQI